MTSQIHHHSPAGGASQLAQTGENLPAVQETWGRSLGREDPLEKGMGNPLQYSCLENSMDRGAWPAIVHEVTESDTNERLTHTHTHTHTHVRTGGFLLCLQQLKKHHCPSLHSFCHSNEDWRCIENWKMPFVVTWNLMFSFLFTSNTQCIFYQTLSRRVVTS